VLYLQAEVQVTEGGPVEILTSKMPTNIWIDEEGLSRGSGKTIH